MSEQNKPCYVWANYMAMHASHEEALDWTPKAEHSELREYVLVTPEVRAAVDGYAVAMVEIEHLKEWQRAIVDVGKAIAKERDEAIAALEFVHSILTLTHPELANVEMDTLTTRQYALWSRSPHAALLERAKKGKG